DRAVGALNSSLEKAAEIEHDEERIRAFCDIGNLFVEIGKKSNAVEAFEQARAEAEQLTNIHRDAFLAQTAIGFLHAGSEELADRTLDSVADKTQIASVVLAFARDHLQKEEKIEAVETLEEAYEILRSQKESETRDSKAKFALFAQIASQFAGAENFNRGIEIADSILIDEHRTNALTQIARIATAQNKDEFAREALGLLHDNAQKMIALIGMSDVVSESDAARASALLDEAIDGSKDVAQTGLRTELLAAIAGRFLSLGNSERSHSIVSMVLDILPDVRNSKTAVSTLVELSATVETGGIQLDDDDKQKIRSLLSPGHG
ncbi:MAG: hypothetical protein ACRD6X_21550, partial [Pyrinomonadaceae bacterium]